MLRFLESMQWVLFIFFTAAYAYQIFYLLVGLWGKQRGGVETVSYTHLTLPTNRMV